MTGAIASAQGVAVSDDFSSFNFNDTLWTYVDPVGDSSIYQANGVLTISVAGGPEHDLWIGANNSVRVMQPVADTDLGLEVKFETVPGSRYQIQGIILEDSPGNYVRSDFVHDGTNLRLYGASFVGNNPTQQGNLVLPLASLVWLRVVRTGDTFVVTWSDDGTTWQTGMSFDHAFTLNSVGVFGGNAGVPAPAFEVVVDYFFDTAAPIDPEDDGLVDIWPPLVGNITAFPEPDSGTATVSCTTNEPATTLLSFGLDENYGTDVVGTSGDGINHQFLLTGLTPDTVVHFSIQATDTLSNSGATADQQFLNEAIDPVSITVWGGLDQRVGHLGPAQADFNLMGNVQMWEILTTMDYSLNGGPGVHLNWGNLPSGFGDARRLARNGDFNVDVPQSQLQAGVNTIAVHAVDIYGREETVVANVTLETGSSPLPLTIAWDTVSDPQDMGQNVDGDWAIDSLGLRTISTGYDRLFLLGEETWQDYEIVCPITIYEVQSPTSVYSGAPGIGFLMRFTGHIVGGHRNWPEAQPKYGYQPFGGIGWLRYVSGPTNPPSVQFYHGDYDLAETFGNAKSAGPISDPMPSPEALPFGDESMVIDFGKFNGVTVGETFWMKMRCETLPDAPDGDGVTRYSYRVWGDSETEPETWSFQVDQESQYALRAGGVCLLAHNVDVTFGDISVIELTPNVPPTAVDDTLSVVSGGAGDVDVVANDLDSDGTVDPTTVAIGDGPLNGVITGVDPVTGVVGYLHNGGVALADSFTYTVADDDGAMSAPATVRVDIEPPVGPTANDDTALVLINSSVEIDLLFNDVPGSSAIDSSTVAILDGPLNGLLGGPDPVTGVVTYTHDGGVALADSFTYTVDDVNALTSNIAVVRITIGQMPAGTFVSDDFNTCVLDTIIWDFIDPQGDTTPATTQGAFGGDAQLAIAVPSGGAHKLYDGVINAPYVIQSTLDDDFTLEVKFDSVLPAVDFAQQGIVVRQDDMNWIGLEFYGGGTGDLNILAGLPDNSTPNDEVISGVPVGTSPMYMRVQRTGDTWTQSYATDGQNWTTLASFDHVLNVTGVGVYGGNDGSYPAHTVLVDYFSNSLAPVSETDDTGTNSLTTSVVGEGTIDRSLDLPAYDCGQMVQLTANPTGGWIFSSWDGDLSGDENPVTITMNATMSVTANFVEIVGSTVAANTSAVLGLSTVNTCATGIPVEIVRAGAENLREFTATIQLTNLALCNDVASIVEGPYLSSQGGTTDFQVIDNLDGTFTVVGSIIGTPCGVTDPTGVLFTLDVENTIPDGTGTIVLTDLSLLDCDESPLSVSAGAPADIVIDSTPPANVTDLSSSTVFTGNAAGNTIAVDLTWTPSTDNTLDQAVLYRKGFGSYPEFDDLTGAVPTAPTDPLAENWTLVTALTPTDAVYSDVAPTRDYWYYCITAVDTYGNQSVGLVANGALNYLLGDVTDGGDPFVDGDNVVDQSDLDLLINRYGTGDGDGTYLNTLDIGPTDDMSVSGRPITDDTINFEDLILMSIDFGRDATAPSWEPLVFAVPPAATINEVYLQNGGEAQVGQPYTVNIWMQADGQVQGLQIPLQWNTDVLALVDVQTGQLLADQGGQSAVLSASAGVIDVALAGVREQGLSGMGSLVQVTFEVLDSGAPELSIIGPLNARDAANNDVVVDLLTAADAPDHEVPPRVSALLPNYPNPFNPMTTIAFDLAAPGHVRLTIYGIDGRLVRTLIDGPLTVGRHEQVWAGRDDRGRSVASGTYLYRMAGPGIEQTRRMLLVK